VRVTDQQRIRVISELLGWIGGTIWDYVVWYRVWPFWLFGVGVVFVVVGYFIEPVWERWRFRRWLRPGRKAREALERERAELRARQAANKRRRNAGRGRRKRQKRKRRAG
jgi:hypothetical protein